MEMEDKAMFYDNKYLVQYWLDDRFYVRIEYFEGLLFLYCSTEPIERLQAFIIVPDGSPVPVEIVSDNGSISIIDNYGNVIDVCK